MRMRRKKNLNARLAECSDIMLEMQCIKSQYNDKPDPKKFFNNQQIFKNNNPVHLEIGCGKGQFIIEMARRNPDINFIALEKSGNVILTAMEDYKETNLTNVRFVNGEAEGLLKLFHENEIQRIYLNFSCPFHKESYGKRRLTHTRFLEIYSKILIANGDIHIKTDNKRLFEFTIEHLSRCEFLIKNVSLDLHNSDFEGNIVTEYEANFSSQGLPIYRLEAVCR